MIHDFPTIEAGGEIRILNCLPSEPARLMASPVRRAGDVSKIEPAFFRPAWLKIKDQDGRGACVGHGAGRAVEFVRAIAGEDFGAEGRWQELSAWDLYARLCNGWDRGANILDALEMLAHEGVATNGSVPYGTINPRQIPAAAVAERPGFRVTLGDRLDSFEAIAEAVAEGDGVAFSVYCGSRFNALDDEGVPPPQRGPANHCVFAGGELVRSKKWGLLVGSDNSWGTAWGMGGRFRIANATIQAQTYFEAFRVRAATRGGNPPVT